MINDRFSLLRNGRNRFRNAALSAAWFCAFCAGAQTPAPLPTVTPSMAPELAPLAPAALTSEIEPAPTTVVGGAWTPMGPGPTRNAQLNVPPNSEVSGGVQALAAHPTDPNILFIGTVNGGVWSTANATSPSPTWTPLTESQASLSIGSIEFDPTDVTSQTLVVGSARLSSFGALGGARIGVLRTTNGGGSWTTLGGATFSNENLTSVAARGSIIMAASDSRWGGGSGSGLFRSTNTGSSFTLVSGTNGLAAGSVSDLVGDPLVSTRFYAAVRGTGIFRSDDSGATWTNVTGNITGITSSTTKIEMAVHNNGVTNAVFVGVLNSSSLAGVWRSTTLGGTWTQMDTPGTGGQGDVHFSIVADPTNSAIVYVGGQAGHFRGDATLATGVQFTSINGAGGGNTTPHADSREMVFDANGNIVEGGDGGIVRRLNPRSSAGTWTTVAGNLAVMEAHDVAYDSVAHIAMIGTQDNGTHIQPTRNATTWTWISGGDGGDVAIDDISTAGQSIRYGSSQNLGGFYRRTYNAANTLINTTFPSLTVLGGGAAITPQFTTPVEVNKVNGARLIIGGANSAYESLDRGNTVTALAAGFGVNGTFSGKPIAYGGYLSGVSNPDVLYYGSGSSVRVRTTAGGPVSATGAAFPGGTVQDIVLDRDDWRHVFVTGSSRIYESTNTGNSWTDITGDLTGVGALHTLEFFPFGTTNCVAAGTDTGVYISFVTNLGTWFKLGSGFPSAGLVYDMTYSVADKLLVAGTMGRGVFALPIDIALVVTATVPNATYIANQGTLPIDAALTVSYNGSATLTGATVAITGNFTSSEDSLVFVDQNGITGSYNAGTGVLTLSGSAAVSTYEAALRSVRYLNSNPNPSTATRTVTFTAFDGANSGSASRSIDIALPGTLRFALAAQTVNAQSGAASIEVDRLGGSAGTVGVTFDTFDGTAIGGVDYTPAVGQSLTFGNGETVKFITIPVALQPTVQFPKTFSVRLTNPTGGANLGANPQTAVTIIDNRPPPNDDFANAVVVSGNSGNVQGFDINASAEGAVENATLGPVVWYRWVAPIDGAVAFTTAGAPGHFVEVLRGTGLPTLEFVSGAGLGKTAAFNVSAGAVYYIAVGGGQDAFTLSWQTTTTGVFEIGGFRTFYDPATGRRAPLLLANEESGTVAVTVRRTGALNGTVSVVLNAIADSSDEFGFANATAGSDFTTTGATLVFNPGESVKSVNVPIANDSTAEEDEDLVIALSTPIGGAVLGNVARLPLVIFDDEGDPANDNLVNAQPIFGVAGEVDGNIEMADPEPGEPAFSDDAAGKTLWYRWVAPLSGLAQFSGGIEEDEGDALVDVFRSDASGLTLVASTAANRRFDAVAGQTYLVRVDGSASQEIFGETELRWSMAIGGVVSFAQATYTVREAAGDTVAQVTIERSGGLNSGASVDLVTFDAPAIADSPTTAGQYAGVARTIFFEPGETSKTVGIVVHHSVAAPGDTAFDVVLTNPTGALLGAIVDTLVKIEDLDDDPANNDFANRVALTGASGSVGGTTAGASREPGEPAHGFFTVWYSWTAPADGLATFSLNGSSSMSQPSVAVHTGAAVGSLAPIALGADGASFVATAGTAYRIAVAEGDAFGNPGAFTLSYAVNGAGSLVRVAATQLSVREDVAGGDLVIALTRSGSTAGTSTVDFQTIGDTAVAGADFTAASGTAAFAPGQTTAAIAIPITNDSLVESNEAFAVRLSNPQGAALSPNATTEIAVTIIDDDVTPAPPPNDNFASATILAGNQPIAGGFTDGATIEAGEPGAPNRSVWFKWTAPATGAAMVSLGDAGHAFNVFTGSGLNNLAPVSYLLGTTFAATAGADYFVQVNALPGANPNFVLSLNFTGAGVLSFSASGLVVNEDAGAATLTIVRTNGSAGAISVKLNTAALTAAAGADFTPVSTTVNFAAGVTSQTVSVPIANDALLEGDEAVQLLLSNPAGGALIGYAAGDAVVLTINDDEDNPRNDQLAAAVAISGPYGATLGNNAGASRQNGEPVHAGAGTGASIWFRWTAPATGVVSFSTEGSAVATALAAYTGTAVGALAELASSAANPSVLSFSATAGSSYVIAVDSATAARGEVALSWNLLLPGVIGFSPVSYTAGESAASVTLTLARAVGSDGAVAVHFATADGSAKAGQDYVAASGDVVFGAGETEATITIGLLEDALFETGEAFTVALTAPTNGATLGLATTATVSLVSNDAFTASAVKFAALVDPAAAFAKSGLITLDEGATGAFTGRLLLGGQTIPLKGAFDALGHALLTVARKGLSPLSIAMQITDGGQTLTGRVYDGSFDAPFSGEASFYDGKTRLYPQPGPFTLALLPTSNAVGIPQGPGIATLTVAKNGTFTIAGGQLADSTTLSASGFIAQSGQARCFAPLHGGKGMLAGVIAFRPQAQTDADGTLRWFKPANLPKQKYFVPGFDTALTLKASSYTAPAGGQRIDGAFDAGSGNAAIALRDGNLAAPLDFTGALDTKNKITLATPLQFQLSGTAKTGKFTGSFMPPGALKRTFTGVFLQKSDEAVGLFLGVSKSGTVRLAPAGM